MMGSRNHHPSPLRIVTDDDSKTSWTTGEQAATRLTVRAFLLDDMFQYIVEAFAEHLPRPHLQEQQLACPYRQRCVGRLRYDKCVSTTGTDESCRQRELTFNRIGVSVSNASTCERNDDSLSGHLRCQFKRWVPQSTLDNEITNIERM